MGNVGALAVGHLRAGTRKSGKHIASLLEQSGLKWLGQTIQVRLEVAVEAVDFDVQVSVSLTRGQKGGGKLSATVPEKQRLSGNYIGYAEGILGELKVRALGGKATGLEQVVPFGVQQQPATTNGAGGGARQNFVVERDRYKATLIQTTSDGSSGSSAFAEGDGIAVEASIMPGPDPALNVKVRAANNTECRRTEATQALEDAMAKADYGPLLAQITKARTRYVEAVLLDKATELLKLLKPAPDDMLTREQLRSSMRWELVTKRPPDLPVSEKETCPASENCPCNTGTGNPEEELTFVEEAVSEALKGVAPEGVAADQWLFEALSDAAADCPEGCVWRAGGKFILSSMDRNQSPTALFQLLAKQNKVAAAAGMQAIVKFTESLYKSKVTAIQTNFHPNEESFHAQHRDIFSAKQKGGLNCTCSFHTCVGTACYSLGSSRQIMLEAMTDDLSALKACGESCKGQRERRWLESGELMYLNTEWNNSYTHGIPVSDRKVGPRISIALLMA